MAEKKVKTRIQCKHDTHANWNKASSFVPYDGELIIYHNSANLEDSTDYIEGNTKFKIGDGSTFVGDLPFQNAVGPTGPQGPKGDDGKGAANGTQLTNQNLNDYHTEVQCGWYYAGSSNTVTNKPSGVDAFGMWVLRTASGYYTQELYGSNNNLNKCYMRTWTSSSWTDWVEKGKDGSKGDKGDQGDKGDTGAHISSVTGDKTPAAGNTVTYTMKNSDNTTAGTFKVVNGTNGTNGATPSVSGSQTTTSTADGGSNVFRFTIDGTNSDFTVKNGSKGSTGATGTRGSRWSTGTAITGTSTTASIFSGTGITDALAGDLYLNTSTGYVYRCAAGGAAAVATWAYIGSIKGATGSQGSQGEQGDQGLEGLSIYKTSASGIGSSTTSINKNTITVPTERTLKIGDLLLSGGGYLYEITALGDTTVTVKYQSYLTGASGSPGNKWYSGTAITGTSTTGTIFSGSGLSYCYKNDRYLNTDTYNIYKCTRAGVASYAQWTYDGNIKGADGNSGASNIIDLSSYDFTSDGLTQLNADLAAIGSSIQNPIIQFSGTLPNSALSNTNLVIFPNYSIIIGLKTTYDYTSGHRMTFTSATGSHVTFVRCYFDCFGSSDTASITRIDNPVDYHFVDCTFKGSYTAALYIVSDSNGNNLVFDHCTFEPGTYPTSSIPGCILLSSCYGVTFNNCNISNNRGGTSGGYTNYCFYNMASSGNWYINTCYNSTTNKPISESDVYLLTNGVISPSTSSGSSDVEGITKITTQYTRITSLETGIYRLAYAGTKYLYYNGSSSTSSHTVGTATADCILYIQKYTSGSTNCWEWHYIVGNSSIRKFVSGKTSSSSGYTYDFNFPAGTGTSGQYLVSGGSSSAPQWKSLSIDDGVLS